jgi:hypothetical protein
MQATTVQEVLVAFDTVVGVSSALCYKADESAVESKK